jgi:glycosyltransferase involved in cell wall biosynthesis
VAILRNKRQSVHLLRVGGIPTPSQARLIEDLSIASTVTHIPYVANQELPSYYAAADVFIFPSLYEGFGIPVLEAMACGTPVIASNAASLPEVVGDAGLLIDPRVPEAWAEAIARVLTDGSLADRLRQRGLERAGQLTWERTARETLQVYEQLLGGIEL